MAVQSWRCICEVTHTVCRDLVRKCCCGIADFIDNGPDMGLFAQLNELGWKHVRVNSRDVRGESTTHGKYGQQQGSDMSCGIADFDRHWFGHGSICAYG